MGYLGRLLVLSLLVSAVVSQRRRTRKNRRRPPTQQAPSMEEGEMNITNHLAMMTNAGCLPNDINIDLSVCDEADPGKETLQCLAKSAGFADESGYNQDASTIFIENLSSEDEQWTAMSLNRLNICNSMMSEDLPVADQGVFVLSCWFMLEKFECNKKRIGIILEQIVGEEGEDIGQWLAYITEGHCVAYGMKNPSSKNDTEECSTMAGLDMEVIKEAGKAYMKFVNGNVENDGDLPSAEDVTELGQQLLNLNGTVHCTMQAIGEINPNGQLDMDLMRENINNSHGEDYIKAAATGILEHCDGQNLASPDEFVQCWFMSQPYACVSLKAHGFALGMQEKPAAPKEKAAGCGGGGRRRAGGKPNRRPRNRKTRRRNRKTQQPQIDEEATAAGR